MLAIVVGPLLARAVRTRASDADVQVTDWIPADSADRMQFLLVGVVIGALLASLRTVLDWVLPRLRWLGSALDGVASAETVLVLALVAVGFMTAHVTLLVRPSLRNIDTKLDCVRRNVTMTRSDSEHAPEGNPVEFDGGRVDAEAGVGYRPDTAGIGMLTGAVVGGIVGLPIGPGGAIGGATAGAAFGDTLERASIRRRDRRLLERRVVEALLQRRRAPRSRCRSRPSWRGFRCTPHSSCGRCCRGWRRTPSRRSGTTSAVRRSESPTPRPRSGGCWSGAGGAVRSVGERSSRHEGSPINHLKVTIDYKILQSITVYKIYKVVGSVFGHTECRHAGSSRNRSIRTPFAPS